MKFKLLISPSNTPNTEQVFLNTASDYFSGIKGRYQSFLKKFEKEEVCNPALFNHLYETAIDEFRDLSKNRGNTTPYADEDIIASFFQVSVDSFGDLNKFVFDTNLIVFREGKEIPSDSSLIINDLLIISFNEIALQAFLAINSLDGLTESNHDDVYVLRLINNYTEPTNDADVNKIVETQPQVETTVLKGDSLLSEDLAASKPNPVLPETKTGLVEDPKTEHFIEPVRQKEKTLKKKKISFVKVVFLIVSIAMFIFISYWGLTNQNKIYTFIKQQLPVSNQAMDDYPKTQNTEIGEGTLDTIEPFSRTKELLETVSDNRLESLEDLESAFEEEKKQSGTDTDTIKKLESRIAQEQNRILLLTLKPIDTNLSKINIEIEKGETDKAIVLLKECRRILDQQVSLFFKDHHSVKLRLEQIRHYEGLLNENIIF